MEERVNRLSTVGPNPTHVIHPLIEWYAEFYSESRLGAIQTLLLLLETLEREEQRK